MVPPAPTYPDGANTPHGAVSSGRQARVHDEGAVEVFPGGGEVAQRLFVLSHNTIHGTFASEGRLKIS